LKRKYIAQKKQNCYLKRSRYKEKSALFHIGRMISLNRSKNGCKPRRLWTKLLSAMTFLQKRSSTKKYLARTCFLAKKQSVPPKAGLRIRLEKWAETIGTRFTRPAFWLLKNRLVRCWCCILELVRTYFSEKIPAREFGKAAEPHR